MISASVRGLDAVHELVAQLKLLNTENMKAAVKASSAIVTQSWKIRLSGPATKTTLGVDTGQLRRSIRPKILGSGMSAVVGTDVVYARIHEFGGDIHGVAGAMPKRPHLARAILDSRKPVEAAFRGKLKEAVETAQARADKLKNAQRVLGAQQRRQGISSRRTQGGRPVPGAIR